MAPEAGTQLSNSSRLAQFGAQLSPELLPAPVLHCAKRALIDWLAAVLAGSSEPAAAKVRQMISAVAPEQVASIVGTDQLTSAPFAAMANGYASHLQDFDDVFNPVQTTVHLGSCVWPVVLAIAQLRPMTGAEALTSFVAGFETGARVGCAAGLGHYESSWQVTGTVGHLASAAAGARALRLDGPASTNALGIGAAQAAGIREIYGSDTKALQPAKAALDGVLGALLAEGGFTSRDTALEGERGLLNAVSPDPDPAFLVAGLNEQWHLLENGHKLYPSASLTHPVIDAAIAMAGRADFDAAQLASAHASLLPFAAAVTAQLHPAPGSAARFSVRHCVAVALLTAGLGLADFDEPMVADPRVHALRDRIAVSADPAIGKRGAVLRVRLQDGSELTEVVHENRGTPGNRLTDAELEAKLRTVAEPLIGVAAAAELLNYCWDFDFVDDASSILQHLSKAMSAAGSGSADPG